LGTLTILKDVLGIGIELIALIAVRRFARDGVVVRFERRDDAAELAEGGVLEKSVIVAGVIDACGHENRGATIVVQARFQVEVFNDAVDDSLLALPRAHQLLHRGPALAEYSLLEII